MDVIERVARAQWKHRQKVGRQAGVILDDWDDELESLREEVRADARAAIEAMRETDKDFVWNAAYDLEPELSCIAGHDLSDDEALRIYNAVIDAALKEPSSSTENPQPTAAQDQPAQTQPSGNYRR